jgi:enoyl-[acyl-carrier protein] reductase/trans-2-enoyl-CoA reductase (NAD+)
MVRNNICINCHPAGCEAATRAQIAYVRGKSTGNDRAKEPGLALILGCSTGYGLASRITAGFGWGMATVGVSLEKVPSGSKTGTPGYYNNQAFDAEAARAGLSSLTLNADAFSDQTRAETIDALRACAEKAGIPATLDLIIYSLASPVRTDPQTGVLYRSVIKPIGASYSGKTVDMMSGKFGEASAEAATDEEIASTVKVMGGEDWELWLAALDRAGLLGEKTRTLAYSYIGPSLSWPIYKNGTIGRAKQDLERAAEAINRAYKGRIAASVCINKAVVTRSSAVIPIIPLYISCLFKVMKQRGLHEGCIEQIYRLFTERLYSGDNLPTDSEGRIRIDDWEMRDEVQAETAALMAQVTQENVNELTDLAGFRHDFLEANGFDVAGIDYEE